MVRRGVGLMIEVIEGVADRVFERMVDGTAALVPNRALVERNRCWSSGARGEEEAEREEERECEGGENGGEDGAEEIE